MLYIFKQSTNIEVNPDNLASLLISSNSLHRRKLHPPHGRSSETCGQWKTGRNSTRWRVSSTLFLLTRRWRSKNAGRTSLRKKTREKTRSGKMRLYLPTPLKQDRTTAPICYTPPGKQLFTLDENSLSLSHLRYIISLSNLGKAKQTNHSCSIQSNSTPI